MVKLKRTRFLCRCEGLILHWWKHSCAHYIPFLPSDPRIYYKLCKSRYLNDFLSVKLPDIWSLNAFMFVYLRDRQVLDQCKHFGESTWSILVKVAVWSWPRLTWWISFSTSACSTRERSDFQQSNTASLHIAVHTYPSVTLSLFLSVPYAHTHKHCFISSLVSNNPAPKCGQHLCCYSLCRLYTKSWSDLHLIAHTHTHTDQHVCVCAIWIIECVIWGTAGSWTHLLPQSGSHSKVSGDGSESLNKREEENE